ncbi:MAG: SlyX family protein [Candidatus Omnitrophica bacterium]|nr:SlyX family protein [Candidatus Omnitrophota bacterium]MCB9746845.1 SlyX family protein [Candidatus Omnitrophota bacterium]
MENRIIELEKRILFLDHQIEELNEALIYQGKVIEELKIQLKNFNDQLQSGSLVRKLEDEEPPPHY